MRNGINTERHVKHQTKDQEEAIMLESNGKGYQQNGRSNGKDRCD